MIKKHSVLLSFLALTVVSQAFAAPTRLALNWKPEPEFGGFYAAKELGFFKKHGLDVDILPGGSGQPVAQMVAAGKVEFGISSADEVLISRARGADLVALFAVYQKHPQGIMVHKSLGLKDISQVFSSGLTLAMQRGLPHTNFLEKKYGFSNVKIVPYAGGIGSFLHDPKFAQQCFVTSEPLAAMKEKSDPQAFLISESGYNPYAAVLVVRGELLKRDKDKVRKMVKAVREGWSSYLKDPQRTNVVMQKLNSSMTLETFAESAEAQKPLIETSETKQLGGLGIMTLTRWQELAKQLVDLKVIDRAPDASAAFVLID